MAKSGHRDAATPSSDAPKPRRRNREQTIRAILDAAEILLERKGPDGFGLAELGREAGVSFGLIHHYFGGKEGLQRAVLRRALGRMGKQIRLMIEGGEFFSRDAPAVHVVLDTFAERPALARLMAWGLLTGLLKVEDFEEQIQEDREAVGKLLHGFRKGVPGATKEGVGATAALLLSAAFGFSLLRPLLATGYEWNEQSDELLRSQLVDAMHAISKGQRE